MDVDAFKKTVYSFYEKNKRDLPWRKDLSPYSILVSEIMLQQTQVSRVIKKYHEFMKRFPDFQSLASASASEVIKEWSGLGYNRRALALKTIAEQVIKDHHGKLPSSPEVLETFPGIGKATAASIVAFAFNLPVVFIETNVRSVFIHHFFKGQQEVSDKDILPLVKVTLDEQNPREWYYALMDLGSVLKKEYNASRQSTHYTKQSPFLTSNRRIRGMIIKQLVKGPNEEEKLKDILNIDDDVLQTNLKQLEKEGFIIKKGKSIRLR
ncbi:A/G-specific adenine glycosylase [Candidatus Pacearchaeota archaeon]|nr:A/G-specific adenine glycosylase [Candidatus Pacearchaeota archaeon]